jgi:hypothetical protein
MHVRMARRAFGRDDRQRERTHRDGVHRSPRGFVDHVRRRACEALVEVKTDGPMPGRSEQRVDQHARVALVEQAAGSQVDV